MPQQDFFKQDIVEFHNTCLTVAQRGNEAFVSLPSLCVALGIADINQRIKVRKNPQFCAQVLPIRALDGKIYETICLPLTRLSLWLCSISPTKLKDEHQRQMLIKFQTECADVLYHHFLGAQTAAPDFSSMTLLLEQKFQEIQKDTLEIKDKLDCLSSISDMVFGDSKDEIHDLISRVAAAEGIDKRTVWGEIRADCDVSSYTKGNEKIIRYLKRRLGVLKLVPPCTGHGG